MERIAISGSHGFIGSKLAERFSSEQLERLGRNETFLGNLKVVFDLAAYGNLVGQDNIHEIYRANLMRVVDTASKSHLSKYIYVSTSSVMLPVQTPYSLSKKATEEFLRFKGNCAIVRPFTVIGVGEHKIHLIPKLIDSCLDGTEMP